MTTRETPSQLQRFVLAENVRLLREKSALVEASRRPQVEVMIRAAERELAMFDAAGAGLRGPWDHLDEAALDQGRTAALARFVEEFQGSSKVAALVDPRPGLNIVEVNPAFEKAAGRNRAAIVGRNFFALFPDNPGDPGATGVASLYASLRRVAQSGAEDAMDRQRYDTQDSDGGWQERHWLPVNRPVKDGEGRLLYVLHLVEEKSEGALEG